MNGSVFKSSGLRQAFQRIGSKMLRWLLLIMIISGAIIVYGSLRASTMYLPLFIAGLILLGIPIGYLAYQMRKYDSDSHKQWIAEVNRLKSTGLKVAVDLTMAEVKSSNWTTEEEKYSETRQLLMTSMGAFPDRSVKTVEHNISRIVADVEKDGKQVTIVSPTIAKDRHTLKMLIEHQGQTYVYFDRERTEVFWLDLEFLEG